MFRKKIAIWWNDKDKIKETCWLLVMWMIMLALIIYITSHNIRVYSGELQEKQGVLFDVWNSLEKYHSGLQILVDGQVYELVNWPLSNKTYGLKYDPDKDKLREELEKRIGSAYSVNLKYVERGKLSPYVFHLTINGEEFVNEEVVRRDLIADEATGRNISIIFLILTVPTLVVVKKRLRYLKDSETA